jgi:restriction system protein
MKSEHAEWAAAMARSLGRPEHEIQSAVAAALARREKAARDWLSSGLLYLALMPAEDDLPETSVQYMDETSAIGRALDALGVEAYPRITTGPGEYWIGAWDDPVTQFTLELTSKVVPAVATIVLGYLKHRGGRSVRAQIGNEELQASTAEEVWNLLQFAVNARQKIIWKQTVVVQGTRISEGTLIVAVPISWYDIITELKHDPAIAFLLPWEKWEEIIAGAYKRAGFDEVTLTPRSGDHGRDVIAIKRGLGSVRVIDSVKAYKPPHLVKANEVRALIGVLQTDGAAKAFLTTTSDFAPRIKKDPTITPWIPSRLELINGEMLLTRLEELARRRDTYSDHHTPHPYPTPGL